MKDKIREILEDTFDVGAEGAVSIVSGIAAQTLIGQVAPGVMTAVMAYKQKRFEKNIGRFCVEIKNRQDEIDARLADLKEGPIIEFANRYFPMVTDYVADEPQEEKIRYIVSGLASMASHKQLSEDFVLTYYDTLKELRLADIAVLKFYYDIYQGEVRLGSGRDILGETGLSDEQYAAIREKLVKIGLMQTEGEKEIDRLYKTVTEIHEFLQGKKKGLPTTRLPTSPNHYGLSRFGVSFVEFFVVRHAEDEEGEAQI